MKLTKCSWNTIALKKSKSIKIEQTFSASFTKDVRSQGKGVLQIRNRVRYSFLFLPLPC